MLCSEIRELCTGHSISLCMKNIGWKTQLQREVWLRIEMWQLFSKYTAVGCLLWHHGLTANNLTPKIQLNENLANLLKKESNLSPFAYALI